MNALTRLIGRRALLLDLAADSTVLSAAHAATSTRTIRRAQNAGLIRIVTSAGIEYPADVALDDWRCLTGSCRVELTDAGRRERAR